jgi:hypothetical protein
MYFGEKKVVLVRVCVSIMHIWDKLHGNVSISKQRQDQACLAEGEGKRLNQHYLQNIQIFCATILERNF